MDDPKISPEIPKRETSLPKYTIDELLEQGLNKLINIFLINK